LVYVNWGSRREAVPAAGQEFASCFRDRDSEVMSLTEIVTFLPRRFVMIKYRSATNKHSGINGLVRSGSRLRFTIRDTEVEAFFAAAGFTNVGLEILSSISTSVYASASHNIITALHQSRSLEN
jgi:hypothetical protein